MVISIDIGGTYIRITTPQKQIIRFENGIFQATFNKICESINSLNTHPTKIGISCVGPLNMQEGIILNTPNLDKSWQGIHLKELLQEKYHCEVNIDNDANVAAFGQYLIQKDKPQSLVYLTFSTGIGAGFIYEGKIYHGFNDTAFEIANALPDYQFRIDGIKSGVEYFAGGNGLVNQSKLNGLGVKNTKTLFEMARYTNDERAIKVLEIAHQKIKSLLSTIIYMINPEIIIIGGSVALNNQKWFQSIIDDVWITTQDINYKTKFKFAESLESATLLACTKL